jgi:hypothetical protein
MDAEDGLACQFPRAMFFILEDGGLQVWHFFIYILSFRFGADSTYVSCFSIS